MALQTTILEHFPNEEYDEAKQEQLEKLRDVLWKLKSNNSIDRRQYQDQQDAPPMPTISRWTRYKSPPMPTSPRRKAPPGTPSVPGIRFILDALESIFVSVFIHCPCLCNCLRLSLTVFFSSRSWPWFIFSLFTSIFPFTCSYLLISLLTRQGGRSCAGARWAPAKKFELGQKI